MSQDGRTSTMGGGAAQPDSSSPITLAVPRPENQRSPNVYVDTPFQHRVVRREELFLPRTTTTTPQELPLVHTTRLTSSSVHRQSKKIHNHDTLQKKHRDVVSTQPTLTFTKGAASPAALDEDSIICGRCGKCRCEACTVPRPPSGTWICGGKCHISAATAVDYLSCLCCVKGVLYHCGKDSDEETPAVASPCSCTGSDACLRWTCLALSSVPLPCLLCYWPLTAIRTLCEKTYRRFTTQGCRCARMPEKRLLQDCV